jgi:teichuronic acid biosynthesis glycosyltransferase TuaC
MSRTIKTLVVTTLYPSAVRPVHGIFVETRLRELLKSGAVESQVISPVPWFPFNSPRFGEYAQYASTPLEETRNGIHVFHPRYFLPPLIGMNLAPYTLALSILTKAMEIQRSGFDFDLIDAHYYYPDGIAAGIVARKLNKPFVVTARGTDLNLIPEYPRPRRLILETAHSAAGSIGVCKALMDRLSELGADPTKLYVIRNGVDLERFHPIDRSEARERLNLGNERILLSVGHLIERKGHNLAIEALASLPNSTILVIAGTGPDLVSLKELAEARNLADRVRFVGQVQNEQLKYWYSAADALVLCSSREGWANVLLESMACGTPVIATNIWGTPEVVSTENSGRLMSDRSPEALVDAYYSLFSSTPDRKAVRKHAERFSWDETTETQVELFRKITSPQCAIHPT